MPETGIATYHPRETGDGEFWLDVKFNGMLFDSVGPFETAGEVQRCMEDIMDMMRMSGAYDMPPWVQ